MKNRSNNQTNGLQALPQSSALSDLPGVSRRNALRYGMGGVAGLFLALTSAGGLLPNAQAQTVTNTGSIDTLKKFLQNVNSLRAVFTQVVYTPQSDKGKSRTQESSGTFTLVRPNQFRFDYTKPYEQQIISDGKTLWLYDVDLEQVTQKTYSDAIGSTPAALLAGGAEAAMAQENFTLAAMPDSSGVQWVRATPKDEEGQIRYADIGFKNGQFDTLVIVDNFGQKSTLKFSKIEVNAQIAPDTFAFKPPKGVDVITQ